MNSSAPDEELAGLVARFRDQSLDAAGMARLEDRLREDVAAREYCAECLRFDAVMRETLHPPARLEWTETRKLILQGGSHWELQRRQSLKYTTLRGEGDVRGHARLTGSRRGFRRPVWKWAGGALLAGLAAMGLLGFLREPVPSPVVLRNPGFEATDLSFSPQGRNTALTDWQDYFPTPEATVVEAARVSQGRVFAKSGRNVAEVPSGFWLTQRLFRADGEAVTARPGLRIRVTGQAMARGGLTSCTLRGSLRFVAGSRPGMLQFEAARAQVSVTGEVWQPFSLDFTLPEDLALPPLHVDAGVPPPQNPDLTGRPLSLSLDNLSLKDLLLESWLYRWFRSEVIAADHSFPRTLWLDDLKIEELPAPSAGK